jgi:hypothetical protein
MARCTYCGRPGHNVKTCSVKTENIKIDALDEIKSSGINKNSYWQSKYAERTGIWLHDGSSASSEKQAVSGRTGKVSCSYCSGQGHNRKGCDPLKLHKLEFLENSKKARLFILKTLRANGMGVGTLLECNHWDGKGIWMVTKINWHRLNWNSFRTTGSDLFNITRLTGASRHPRYNNNTLTSCPRLQLSEADREAGRTQEYWSSQVLASRSDTGCNPPPGWLNGEDIDLDTIFSNMKIEDFSYTYQFPSFE